MKRIVGVSWVVGRITGAEGRDGEGRERYEWRVKEEQEEEKGHLAGRRRQSTREGDMAE